MAENEMLDISNPFIYKRWRQLIASGRVDPCDAADALYLDFSTALRRAMRQEPLSRVFAACGEDREALQAAVATCKDRSLAMLIEHACKIVAPSRDAVAVATAVAGLMIATLAEQCNRQAFGLAITDTRNGQQAMESATLNRLEAAEPDIINWLSAALQGRVSEVPRPTRSRRPSAEELLNTSLTPLPRHVKRGTSHV